MSVATVDSLPPGRSPSRAAVYRRRLPDRIVRGFFTANIGRMKKIISTPEAPAALGPYSQAVRAGSTIYCAGQIPLDPKSGQIVSRGIEEQTRRVLENIAAVLERGRADVREHC